MQTTRMFLPVNQSGTDLLAMLAKATEEGKAASADLCSAVWISWQLLLRTKV